MRKTFKHKTGFWLILTVIILSISIGIFNAASDVTFAEDALNIVFTPMQKLFSNISNGVSGFWGYFSEKDGLHDEIARLKNENAELKKQIAENESSKSENEQLRKLLNLKSTNTEFEFLPAQVIARNPSNWYNTLTIDKGTADGIALNQPVISAGNSLVGRIGEVGTTWAKVILLTDTEHSAGSQILRSGEYGICEGEGDISSNGGCKLSFVSKNANIIVGDTVITSGLGGIYPKGLIIGKIHKIRPDIQGISQYAVISPEADFKNLQAVFVIQNAAK